MTAPAPTILDRPQAALPTLSVAMGSYNGGKYILRQLQSLADQTLKPSEIVIADDQSDDDTTELIGRFAEAHPDIRVILVRNESRLGYRRNFLKAANLCSGEVIFFCDQDDVWLERKFETVMAQFADPDVLFVYHGAALVDAEERRLGTLYADAVEQRNAGLEPPHPWHHSLGFTQAFRRELLRFDDLWPQSRDQNFDDVLAHDQWFVFLAAALGKVVYLPEELALYRQHGANVYGARSRGLLARISKQLTVASPPAGRMLRAAESRRDVLRSVAQRSDGKRAARAADQAARYQILADRWARHEAVNEGTGAARRIAAYTSAIMHGDYGREAHWALPTGLAYVDLRTAILGPASPAPGRSAGS